MESQCRPRALPHGQHFLRRFNLSAATISSSGGSSKPEIYRSFHNLRMDDAMSIFIEMKQKGIKPNVITYTIILEALLRIGSMEDVQNLLHEMVELGTHLRVSCQPQMGLMECHLTLPECSPAEDSHASLKVNSQIQKVVRGLNSMILEILETSHLKDPFAKASLSLSHTVTTSRPAGKYEDLELGAEQNQQGTREEEIQCSTARAKCLGPRTFDKTASTALQKLKVFLKCQDGCYLRIFQKHFGAQESGNGPCLILFHTKESSMLNLAMTVFHLIFFAFVIISSQSTHQCYTYIAK